MSIIYSAADLVISRAGALAISELCYMGKAMILIPFKFAADNHQELNAMEIKHNNACIKINEDDLKTGLLEKKIKKIFDDSENINELENNSLRIARSNATKDIIQNIIKVINA